jgi:hypothetical protein
MAAERVLDETLRHPLVLSDNAKAGRYWNQHSRVSIPANKTEAIDDLEVNNINAHTDIGRSTSILLEYINPFEESREREMHWREHSELRGIIPVAESID